jgi:hypothetical protein
VAALLPEGHRAVTVTIGPLGAPPVQVGDAVDVVAVLPTEADRHGHGQPFDDESSSPAVPLVDRALVIDVADDAITVAVPVADAPAVAYAAVQGIAVLLLAGA